MAVDRAIDSTEFDSKLTTVADAIRTAGGTTEPMSFPSGMVEAITAIQAGGNIASGSISWATIPSTPVKTEFVHNLGVSPKLFLIFPAFGITSSPQKNIGIHLISTGSLSALSRYTNGNMALYPNMSTYVMKSMQYFSESKLGVYADSTKLILVTRLDVVFSVNQGDIYNWIAVG